MSDTNANNQGQEPSSHHRRRQERRGHPSGTPASYRVVEQVSEALLWFMIICSPWAFGTTQPWSIWTMNGAAYLLGLLLAAKWVLRWRTGFVPPRWGTTRAPDRATQNQLALWSTRGLAAGSLIVLGWVLVSILNARADYQPERRAFVYFPCVTWLPHTYDRTTSWFYFWQYVGLACYFWSLRDWLLTMERGDRRHEDPETHHDPPRPSRLPARLRRLLWVLSINAALLSLVAILHKLQGSDKLLWILKSRTAAADRHFGPYNYRSNAAQYLNLIWPLILGLWWLTRREARQRRPGGQRLGEGAHTLLLPCLGITAVAPIVSNSRAGALVAVVLILISAALLLVSVPRRHFRIWLSILGGVMIITGMGVALAWKQLSQRLYRYLEIVPTNYVIGTNDFSLGIQFQISRDKAQQQRALAVLSPSKSRAWGNLPSFSAYIETNGDIVLKFFDEEGSGYVSKTIPQFLAGKAGQIVDLWVVRRGGTLHLFAAGQRLDGRESSSDAKVKWSNYLHSSFLWVGGFGENALNLEHPVRRAVLYNHALESPGTNHFAGAGDSISFEVYRSNFEVQPDGFQTLYPGTTRQVLEQTNAQGSFTWLQIMRDSGSGPLLASRSMPELEASLSLRCRTKTILRNLDDKPHRVGFALRDGPPGTALDLPALGEISAGLELLSNDNATPKLTVGFVGPSGEWQADVMAGEGFQLRELEVDPLGMISGITMPDRPVIRMGQKDWSGRPTIYRNARLMADDYPWFGSGAGTYMNLSQLYREEATGKWPAYVHDDWLETRITFGRLGLALLLTNLLLACTAGCRGAIPVPWELKLLLVLSMAAFFGQSHFDYPFQIYSLVLVFLTGCCLLTCLRSTTK